MIHHQHDHNQLLGFLSIVIAIFSSYVALDLANSLALSKGRARWIWLSGGSLAMGIGIWSMHFVAMLAFSLPSVSIAYDVPLLILSIIVAIGASALTLHIVSSDLISTRTYIFGSLTMGAAIAGMHYTAMAAMSFTPSAVKLIEDDQLLATTGLAVVVIIGTLVILTIALSGSILDKALTRRIALSQALEDTVKSRDEFLSIVSHELKTPLTTMKFQIQLSLRTLVGIHPIDEKKKRKLESMLIQTDKSIIRINRLVDDMLDISRISTGKLALQPENFELDETIAEVVDRLSPLLGDIIFTTEKSVRGNWDKFRIEQVITNLLTNAAKYGNKKPIFVNLTKINGNAKISIKDSGRGIAKEDHEKIFQRFQRIKAIDQISGLGIGLYIVKEIVQMHKGTIEVKSALNEGAEFIVIMPLS